jgi:TolR protein
VNAPTSLSVITLFDNADIVVKTVLLLLLAGSVWSWAVIADKLLRLRSARHSATAWMDRATGARIADELIGGRLGVRSDQPAGAVITAGIEECMVDEGSAETPAERRERIERAMRLALGAQLRLLEHRLPFLATLGSAAPFVGLFGTVWGIMRSFNAIAAALRHRDGARSGNPCGGLLQQVHGRNRPLRRDHAGVNRAQWRAIEPRGDGESLAMAISLPPSGEPGEERYIPLAEINVTPMVDVMLVLLVIFMVAAPLLTVGVPVNLPKTSAAEITEPQKPVIVSMNAQGEYFIGDDKVGTDDLKTQLAALAQADPARIVYVRGDRTIEYGKLMDLLGLVNTAGFAKVSLIAEAAKPN